MCIILPYLSLTEPVNILMNELASYAMCFHVSNHYKEKIIQINIQATKISPAVEKSRSQEAEKI